jgi:Family of unknown function (DUF6573)
MSDQSDDIIYVYSRKRALEDGEQVDANIGDLAEVTRQHFKFPVYMTRAVYDLMERAVNNRKWMNDWKGVWHDICWMCRQAVRGLPRGEDTAVFQVIIRGAGKKCVYTLRAVCEEKEFDDAQPVITIMMADED